MTSRKSGSQKKALDCRMVARLVARRSYFETIGLSGFFVLVPLTGNQSNQENEKKRIDQNTPLLGIRHAHRCFDLGFRELVSGSKTKTTQQ